MMPVEHFKNAEAYRKNLAYRHIHGIPFTATSVDVGGKTHEVKHSTDPKRVAIDSQQRRKTMKVSEKEHEKLEKKETPAFEAKEHGSKFLKKAARMADKKLGERKSHKHMGRKHHSRAKSA